MYRLSTSRLCTCTVRPAKTVQAALGSGRGGGHDPLTGTYGGALMRSRIGKVALAAVVVALALAPAASAKVRVSFERLKGFDAPDTPAKYDKVGALKVGPKNARNVLILNPGTS